MTELDAPRADDRKSVAAFRAALDRAGYTAAGVHDAFGDAGFTRDPADVPLHLRRLPPDVPISTLIKLFLLDLTLPGEEVSRALAPFTIERAVRLGVLRPADGGTLATMNLIPSEGLLIASDRFEGQSPDRPDHVLGVSISSHALGAIVVRDEVESALDVGTGSGIHALMAVRHARRAVGVDINPRAIRFAEFNAALNGIENVEFRVGNAFEPVEGETFDLILSNPPYVVSPDRDFIFRDSGLPGDTFNEGLIRRIPDFLNEGGRAHVLVEWGHGTEEHPGLVPRRWVEGSGCDALVIHYATHDPLTYAATWNIGLRGDAEAYGAAIDRWVAYDRELGIKQLSWGAVVLRKRSGRNWIRTVDLGISKLGHASHHVTRLLATQDFLSTLGPGRGLLDGVFELADDHRFDHTFSLRDSEGELETIVLRLEGGLQTSAHLDRAMLRLVSLLDGRRPLHDVLAQVASEAAEPIAPGDAAIHMLPPFTRLLDLGLVVPSPEQG